MSFDPAHDVEDGTLDATPRSDTPRDSSGFEHDGFDERQPSTAEFGRYDDDEGKLVEHDSERQDAGYYDEMTDDDVDRGSRGDEASGGDGVSELDEEDLDDEENLSALERDGPEEGEGLEDDVDGDDEQNANTDQGGGDDSGLSGQGPDVRLGGAREKDSKDDGDDDDGATADEDEDENEQDDAANHVQGNGESIAGIDYDDARYSYRSLAGLYPERVVHGSGEDGEVGDDAHEGGAEYHAVQDEATAAIPSPPRSAKARARVSLISRTAQAGKDEMHTETFAYSTRPQRQRRRPQRWEGAAPVLTSIRGALAIGTGSSAKTIPRTSSNGHGSGRSRGGKVDIVARNLEHPSKQSILHSSKKLPAIREEDISTVSIRSGGTMSPPPEPVDPVENMHAAMDVVRAEAEKCDGGPRSIVERFHNWQRMTISAEANYQKALHSYLKRKLRKRALRSQEHERIEEDALRNACSAVSRIGGCADGGTEDWGDEGDAGSNIEVRKRGGEAGLHGKKRKRMDDVVPRVVRLPLEAYLPRRVCKANNILTVDQFIHSLPRSPRRPQGSNDGAIHRGRGRDGDRSRHSKRGNEKLSLAVWTPRGG
jgi:hypothetical protein